MLKLLLSGHASACLRHLREVGLHKGLLPLLDVILEQPLGERFVTLALAQTDERVLAGRPVSPAFLFAARCGTKCSPRGRRARARRARHPGARDAMDEVLDTQCAKLAITRRLTATMREVWAMQPRFESRSGNRAYRLLEAPRFRMAYDFLALRAASGEVPAELEAWWRGFQAADADAQGDAAPGDRAEEAQAPPPQKRPVPAAAPRPDGVTIVYVGIGSNLADPVRQVSAALRELDVLPHPAGEAIVAVSQRSGRLPTARFRERRRAARDCAPGRAPARRAAGDRARHGRTRSFPNAPRPRPRSAVIRGCGACACPRSPFRTRACTSGLSC